MLDEEIKEFFKILLPMIGTRFIGFITGFFSMLMLSRSSLEAAASCALISSLLGLYMATAQGMLNPVGIEYAMSNMKKDFRKTEALFLNGFLISLLLFLLWMGLVYLTPYLGNFFSIDRNIILYVKNYFMNITPGIGCSLLYFLCCQLLSAENKQLNDAFFSLISCVVFAISFFLMQINHHNIYVSITNSTNISSVVLLFFCIYYYVKVKKINIQIIQQKIDLTLFISLIKSGFMIFTQISGELVAFTVITLLLGTLGANVLIAQRELNQIAILFVISAAAMGQAASIVVAKKKSHLNQKMLRRFVKKIFLVLSLIYLLCLYVLIINDKPNLSTISRNIVTKKILLLFSLTVYLDTLRYFSSGILRGLGNYKLPTLAGLLGLWGICMPSLLLLSQFNCLTFELSRILVLIGIFVPCLIQLISCLVIIGPLSPPSVGLWRKLASIKPL